MDSGTDVMKLIGVFFESVLMGRRWEDNIKMDLQEVGGSCGTGWSWLRTGTGGGRLWVR